MKNTRMCVYGMVAVLALGCVLLGAGESVAKDKYRIAWSHYTGWEPWEYARHSGVLKKWADKYGIEIELSEPMDYAESINLYTAGQFIGCVMTNMDALMTPAVGGVDSTAIIVGDYSNGNDGIVMKKGAKVADLRGRNIKLVELSVSHYLLSRALDMNGMKEKEVKTINTSDSDIASVFLNDPSGVAVTWNPILMQVRNVKGATMVFDSSKIPGEILDLMVVRTNAPETLKKALTGAWFEVLGTMQKRDKAGKEAVQYMAKFAGATEAEFEGQLKTTMMFYAPADALKFTRSEQLKKTMDYVRGFCFDHGLLGQNARSKDQVGIEIDGAVLGDKNNIRFRFDATFMQLAADGKL
jgi:NitT/TauT family transport system substrate-binding protein